MNEDPKKKITTQLFDLGAEEISIVDRGAVDGENFLILKGEHMKVEDLKKVEEVLKMELPDEKKVDEELSKVEKIDESQKSAVKAALKLLFANKEIVPPSVFAQLGDLVGYGYPKKRETYPEDKGYNPEMEKVKKALETLPEEVRKNVENQMKDSKEKVEKMEKELKGIKDEAAKKEFIQKAGAFKNVGSADELGLILKDVSEKCPESATKLEAILKATNERIEKGDLFKEQGSSGSGTGDAYEKIEKMAKDRAEKDRISFEKAYSLILKENPKLYTEQEKKE